MPVEAHRVQESLPARRTGFTLIELLVVVSVVALMMAVLSPSLKSARAQAKQVVCASRLKQWAVAFTCYAGENSSVWPHCDGLDRGPRALDDRHISPEDVADWHGWVDLLPPMINLTPWRDHPRYDYPKESTFYQCPDGGIIDGQNYSYRPKREGYFSYAMNSCLELDRNAWPPLGGTDYPMPSFLSTARIACPQRVYVLFDQLLDPRKGFDAKKLYRGAGKYCGSYPKSFSARHRHGKDALGGNILFADGHTEWKESVWDPHWNPEQEVPPRSDPNWYPYPPPPRRDDPDDEY
ncbi:MAG: prepilin-type N-terminal cleavage/methylation domain-containing protein [Phycisphaerales bacterium]|nr:MAG: prepilin-type N-terminal cleavage/methylation domain-containing protein [Phycisphaerales bacterium]